MELVERLRRASRPARRPRQAPGAGGGAANPPLAALLVLAAPWLGAGPRVESGGTDERADALASVLAEAGDAEQLARGLDALGQEALPDLLGLLEGTGPHLRPWQRVVVQGTVARVPRARLLSELSARADPRSSAAARRTALEVLGAVALPEDFDLLVALAAPSEADVPAPPGVRRAFERALARTMARDGRALRRARELYEAAPASLLLPVIRAVGATGTEAGLLALGDLLDALPEADGLVLCEMARLGARLPHPLDESLLAAVRGHLAWSDVDLHHAVLASGALEDYEAIPLLIELLQRDDPALGERAGTALAAIRGVSARLEPHEWQRWYESELAWWADERGRHEAALRAGDPALAAEAMRSFALHRLRRHELARRLAFGLAREEPELVALCCGALAQLGSPTVAGELEACLEHQDERVRAAARAALGAIGGSPPER